MIGDDRRAQLLGRLRLHRQHRAGRGGGPGDSSACCSTRSTRATSSTSARFEENIALAGILAAHEMGTIEAERPDGKPFNPYVLTDDELATARSC